MGSGIDNRCPFLVFLVSKDWLFNSMELPGHISYAYRRLEEIAAERGLQVLSDKEQVFLDQISSKKRRLEFISGRLVARELAGEALGCKPEEVDLRIHEDGSLFLHNVSCGISLAHTHNGVCAAIAHQGEVGIDLETIQPRDEGLHRFFLHPDEYDLLEALPFGRHESLILCWTLKEATLKGMKTGFRCSPKKLRLAIDTDQKVADIAVEGQGIWSAHYEKRDGCYLSIAYPKP